MREKHYRVAGEDPPSTLTPEGATGMQLVKANRPTLFNSKVGMKVYSKRHLSISLDELYLQLAVLRKLSHRHILPLQAIYEDDTDLYFVFDISPDLVLLSQYASNLKCSECLVAEWMRQTLLGLEHLHSKGAAHGALQLESIFYNPTKDLIVISGYEGNKLRTSPYSQNLVTHEVQAIGRNGQPSDLYSLGIVIHQLLTGIKPIIDSVNSNYSDLANSLAKYPLALNLVTQLLSPQPISRPTAFQALQHPWFSTPRKV
ncbi:hypothetical protein L0F63_004586 [Massospora cicadina]|nr:hypothetical protein L0F63_004586 [Massospora cicadina]